MWNDNDTHIDLIDVNYLVDGVKSIVGNDNLIPCTIGVFGDWGSGKSSLMKMIESEYTDDDETLVIQFNGWLFEGYDDAKTALMTTIVEHVISKRTLSETAIATAKKLFKQIDWLKVAKYTVAHGLVFAATGGVGNAMIEMHRLANTTGSDVAESAKGALTGFSEGNYDDRIKQITEAAASDKSASLQMGIRDFHSSFGELLEQTKIKRLLVFIDDLDRCTPDTIIATLEAIKLFLFIEHSAFIISADERLIKYAVRRRFPEIPGDASEVGRDYLEKLIQFPLRIPSLSESEMESYVNLLFSSIHISDKETFEKLRMQALEKRSSDLFGSALNSRSITEFLGETEIPAELVEDLGLSAQIIPILSPGLNGNPRQCKRFLNTLLMRFRMAQTRNIELKKRVLAKLMLLEYFKPETFRTISDLQSKQEGKPKEIALIEGHLSQEATEGDDQEQLQEEFSSWLGDTWLNKWFNASPKISEVDLRPYFFFSRDKLNAIGAESSRMSSQAQEVYQKLISESGATNKLGIKAVAELSSGDVAAVFHAFTNKIREADTSSSRNKMIKILCLISEAKTELHSELFSFFKSFPTSNLSIAVVPQFLKATKNTAAPNRITETLTVWSNADNNKGLVMAAKKQLDK